VVARTWKSAGGSGGKSDTNKGGAGRREREWWSQNFGSHGARLETKKIEHKLIKKYN
jgi:hypothetical protein